MLRFYLPLPVYVPPHAAHIHSSLSKYIVFLCFIDTGGMKSDARVQDLAYLIELWRFIFWNPLSQTDLLILTIFPSQSHL